MNICFGSIIQLLVERQRYPVRGLDITQDIHRCMQRLLLQVCQQYRVSFGITAVELRRCTVWDPACMLCSSCM